MKKSKTYFLFKSSIPQLSCGCRPVIPAKRICRPVTNSATPINIPVKTRPIAVNAITIIANIIERIPVPTLNDLAHFAACLSRTPWTILETPSTNKATPNNSTTRILASTGKPKLLATQ